MVADDRPGPRFAARAFASTGGRNIAGDPCSGGRDKFHLPISPSSIDHGISMSLSRLARNFTALAAALAILLVPLLIASCTAKSGGFVTTEPAHLRFVNALVDGGAISVDVNNETLVTGVPFEGVTSYVDINSGSQEVRIVANNTSTIYDATSLFIDDASYTFIVYGTSAAPVVQLITDAAATSTAPEGGQFALRVFNAAYASGGVDVYVTTPGASLDNMSPNFSNLPYGNITLFSQIATGSYQVRFTLPNSKQVIYDAGTVAFAEKAVYQLVAYTKGSATLVSAALMAIDSVGAGSAVQSTLAQFKFIHAAPGTTAVNAFIDGTTALANIPYLGASSYETLLAGTHRVTVETVATPGAVIAATQPTFAPSTDTTVVLTGTPGAQTAVVLADNNLPGTAGSARLRFVNVASNVGAIDVYVNFAQRVAGIPTNAASGYFELPENTYAITFNLAGTTTVLLNLPGVAVASGGTYTLYLAGTADALTGLLTHDD
jgi:hypothetical protein